MKSDIAATKANEIAGVPAIFGSEYFDEVSALKGEKGDNAVIVKKQTTSYCFCK